MKHSYLGRDLFWLALIVGAFFLLMLGVRPLTSPDENRYAGAAFFMLQQHNWITPKINGAPFLDKPILYYWLEMLSMKVLGVNNWAIRLPQMLFGLFGVLMTFFVTTKLYGRRTAWLAAAILATSPLYFTFAHYSNMSLQVAVLISGSLFSMLLAQRSEQHRYWMWLAYAFAGLAMLTKGLMAIAFPMMIAFVWMLSLNYWHRLKQLHIPTGIVIMAIIAGPWLYLVQQDNAWFLQFFFYYQQVERFLGTGFNNPMPFWFYVPIITLGLFPWSVFSLPAWGKLRQLWQGRHTQTDTWFLLLWVVLIWLFFSVPQSKIVDYILPVFPAAAVLLARFIDQQWQQPTRSFKAMIAIGAVLVFAIDLVLLALPAINTRVPMAAFPYLRILAGWLLILAGLSVFWLMRHKIKRIVILWVIGMAGFNLIALSAVPIADNTNIQPLIQRVQPYITAKTEVVSYFNYFYALPIALERPVWVVYPWQNKADIMGTDNWARELLFGVEHNPQSGRYLLTTQAWKKLWQSGEKTFIIFTDRFRWDVIQNWQPKAYCIGHYQQRIVVTNSKQIGEKLRDNCQN